MLPHEFLTLAARVNPEVKDEMEAVFTPKGTGPVAVSPHFIFIVCNILRGYTPREVAEQVEREKKAFITVDAIRDYQLQFVPPQLMHTNLKHRWIQNMESLDEIDVMESLMKLQMMNVMHRMDSPSTDLEEQESRRRDVDCLRKLTMDTLKAKIDTGRMADADEKNADPDYVPPALPGQTDVPPDEVPLETGFHSIGERGAAAVLRAMNQLDGLAEDNGDDPTRH